MAEDIAQEAFLRLYQELRQGRTVQNVQAWLYRAAHNLALNHRRADGRLSQLEDDAASLCSAAGMAGEEDLSHRMQAALGLLSPREQRCIQLRMEGKRYREIADLLGVRISSVSNYLDRAIAKLRQTVTA